MLRVPHGTDTLLIQISMCTISNLVSSVRVQVEVMALLMSLQRAMAVVLSNLRLKDESQNSMNTPFKAGVALFESTATTILMLRILQWRFSTGANTRKWRYNRNRLRSDTTTAELFVRMVVLCLASFAVFGVGIGSMFGVASVENVLSVALYCSRTSVGAVQVAVGSMIADPILEEAFYRGVVFDRLLGREEEEVLYTAVAKAATASSSLFGGMHLLMHKLRNGVPLSWLVYQQALWATGAGYVYCLLYFLGGGRLLPTVLLHSVNNIAASFYSPNIVQTRGASGTRLHSGGFRGENGSEKGQKNASGIIANIEVCKLTDTSTATSTSSCRTAEKVVDHQGIWVPELRGTCLMDKTSIEAGKGAIVSGGLCAGYVATALAYCIAGIACSRRLRQLSARPGTEGRYSCCTNSEVDRSYNNVAKALS